MAESKSTQTRFVRDNTGVRSMGASDAGASMKFYYYEYHNQDSSLDNPIVS